jgi:hypothetical protein
MSAAIGGTAEALGGGKFANGAITGAYVMIFNHLEGDLKDHFSKKGKILPPVDFYYNDDVFEVSGDGIYLLWDNQWHKIPGNGGTVAYRDGWDLSFTTPEATLSGIQRVKWDYTTGLIRRESITAATWGGGIGGTVGSVASYISSGFKISAIPSTIIIGGTVYVGSQFDTVINMQNRMMEHDLRVRANRAYHLKNK